MTGSEVARRIAVACGDPHGGSICRRWQFPNILDLDDYRSLLQDCGCRVETAEDTGRFAAHVDLYLNMLNMQLTYDALKRIGFDMELMQALGSEMSFIQQLADEGKICQGRFVASKT